MKRVMCVHFPDWPLQRLRQARPELRDGPLVVMARRKVLAGCPRSQRAGVRPGMPAAEALALLPTLTLVDEDLDADRALLLRLAAWSQRYSPIVGIEEALAPSSLYLDVTGGADCFGGEGPLLRRVEAEFREQGWQVQATIADTIGAAHALSRGVGSASMKPGLNQMPIAALRLPAGAVALLDQFGIERVEHLADLPRAEVAERFGHDVLRRLDQALGQRAEVIQPYHAEPDAEASLRFEYPIVHGQALTAAAQHLLVRLEAVLEKRGLGARLLECLLYLDLPRTESLLTCQRIECSLSRPMRSAAYLGPLLAVHLEKVRAPAPVQGVRVRAAIAERMVDQQPTLFEASPPADGESWSQLLDSLASRLGKDAVAQVQLVADPQPERAYCLASALAAQPTQPDGQPPVQRPLRLFPRPLPLEMIGVEGAPMRFLRGGVEHVVQSMRGPERIETGWWREADIHRDYFVVDLADGTRWWLFRRLEDGRWFLHGCFD